MHIGVVDVLPVHVLRCEAHQAAFAPERFADTL